MPETHYSLYTESLSQVVPDSQPVFFLLAGGQATYYAAGHLEEIIAGILK